METCSFCRRRQPQAPSVPTMTKTLMVMMMAVLMTTQTIRADATKDHRFISYPDLLPSMYQFAARNGSRYSEIVLDNLKYQLIVGARDHLYRLSARTLELLEAVHWPPPAHDVTMCVNKGMTSADCHNYVRVLRRRDEKLLVCGTSAFRPQCSWRSLEALAQVYDQFAGTAVCPYSPHMNVTSLVTSEGEVFAGSPTDFSGLDPAVYGGKAKLRTSKYDSRLLSGPQFVGSFETTDHVYTVFREHAVEYMSCGTRAFSRISRVCKNDRGNRRHVWTTFLKARLNCSVPGEYPFYLDHVQSVQYLPQQQLLYATFTTPDSALPGSAVCVFSLKAVEAAFSGAFRQQDAPDGVWRRREDVSREHFQCRSPGLTSGHELAELAQISLMDEAVQQQHGRPLIVLEGVRLTKLVVDASTARHVLFAADEEGLLRKMSVLSDGTACLLEVMQPFPEPTTVLTAKILPAAAALYLGTEAALVSVPLHRCERYGGEETCLEARDPYCGWDSVLRRCTPAPGGTTSSRNWRQLELQCPDLTAPVHGGWSAWGDWKTCRLRDGDTTGVGCMCRTRSCTSPPPSGGGASCEGEAAEVTNCTRHGGWTAWSAWSSCSKPCGAAVKTRSRSCTNPSPVHNGRPCSGDAVQEALCLSNPPCPTEDNLPVDGGWSEWGRWGPCSSPCGGGFQKRRRACDQPRPVNGGRLCLGCDEQWATCNRQACAELRQLTEWTPWMPSPDGNGREARFRFQCSAPVPDQDSVVLSPPQRDERHCTDRGVCGPALWSGVGWGDWSEWSACSSPCGGGVQFRSRLCDGDESACLGPDRMEQECNTQPCKGEWSCWSEWSTCSASCGPGHRSRQRRCQPALGAADKRATCDGAATERQPCQLTSCAEVRGWSQWSLWSSCNSEGQQLRRRACAIKTPTSAFCQGDSTERRPCITKADGAMLTGAAPGSSGAIGAGRMAAACVACFFIGGLLAAACTYYILIKRKPGSLGASHLYDTLTKPMNNTYVSVKGVHELAELKRGKRASGLPKTTDFPEKTATIRRTGSSRYSAAVAAELRANLASDAEYS